MASSPVARAWLLTRVDHRSSEAILTLLRQMTGDLSLATADAVTVGRVSADEQWLCPALRLPLRPGVPRRDRGQHGGRRAAAHPAGRARRRRRARAVRRRLAVPDDDEELLADFARRAALAFHLPVPTFGGGQLLPEGGGASASRRQGHCRHPGGRSRWALRTSPRPCWMHRQPGWSKGVSSEGRGGASRSWQAAPQPTAAGLRARNEGRPEATAVRSGPRLFANSGPGISPGPRGGGGGNRTRVLRRITRASPSAVCVASARPRRSCRQVDVTGPVTVWCPARARDRHAQ
jgi:hypothetical protein